MNYAPRVGKMNRAAVGPLGPAHTALLFDGIESAGLVKYAFLVLVFDDQTRQPVCFVASEENAGAAFGGGSHVLGLFPGDGHMNLGSSDDWADAAKFFPKAIAVAAGQLGLPPDAGQGLVAPPSRPA